MPSASAMQRIGNRQRSYGRMASDLRRVGVASKASTGNREIRKKKKLGPLSKRWNQF